jgi:hypothetical protein
MKKIALIFLALILSINSFGQRKLKNNIFQDENSAVTENKLKMAEENVKEAYFAYYANDLEKAKYFIDQSQRAGTKIGDFYFLLGAYMYRTKEIKAAKRYWKISHKEGGCWDCKKLLDLLVQNENDEEIPKLIDQKVKVYVESNSEKKE